MSLFLEIDIVLTTAVELLCYHNHKHFSKTGQQSYSFESIKRECASEPVTRQCNTTVVKGPGLEYVTCQETCDSDGCNVGWRE